VLAYASTRSIAHHARNERNPLAGDPAALKRGLDHYREDCLACHGAPGAHPQEVAAGLHPRPPDLASPQVQSFTDGMLYATIADGIGSTGMPAFGAAHRPEDIWCMVAFLRHLPALTPEERQELAREAGHEQEQEPAAEAAASSAWPAAPAQGGRAAAPGPGSHLHTVQITGFEFAPATLEVHVGDVVEWKNADPVAHTATAGDHTFDTGQIDGGAASRVVARGKGRFAYSCRYHPEMKGTLVVQ
jgi:plastocyanin